MGLGSYHSKTVTAVAKQMAATASEARVEFVVNTGDNFYYCGITNTSDPQVATDFTEPYGKYASINVPWYGVLGNHEYGYDVDAQIQLSKESLAPKWVLDARYFTRRIAIGAGHFASFVFIDSNPCVSDYRKNDPKNWDPCGSDFPTCDPIDRGPCQFHANIMSQSCDTQFAWFKKALAAVPKSDWLIIVGHHPADEIDVQDFTSAMQARGFDLYLNGHTHTLTQYSVDGKGAFVTSGAGAMIHTQDQHHEVVSLKLAGGNIDNTTSGHSYKTIWNQKVAGFTLHTFSDDYKSLKTEYISYKGETVHHFTVTKGTALSSDAYYV
jgi:predicted MPP superfamily phosphohydrolase